MNGKTPRKIWRRPCPNCPSMLPDDPESAEMKIWYKEGKISVWDAIFPCAWRSMKMCHGVCKGSGITEEDLHGPVQGVFQ